jgi:hypothetical protein
VKSPLNRPKKWANGPFFKQDLAHKTGPSTCENPLNGPKAHYFSLIKKKKIKIYK